jgi:hypothetical protein
MLAETRQMRRGSTRHEYEQRNVDEALEQFEIKSMIKTRLETYDAQKNIPWEKIREEV